MPIKSDPHKGRSFHESFRGGLGTPFSKGAPSVLPLLARYRNAAESRVGQLTRTVADGLLRDCVDVLQKFAQIAADHRLAERAGDLAVLNEERVLRYAGEIAAGARIAAGEASHQNAALNAPSAKP